MFWLLWNEKFYRCKTQQLCFAALYILEDRCWFFFCFCLVEYLISNLLPQSSEFLNILVWLSLQQFTLAISSHFRVMCVRTLCMFVKIFIPKNCDGCIILSIISIVNNTRMGVWGNSFQSQSKYGIAIDCLLKYTKHNHFSFALTDGIL